MEKYAVKKFPSLVLVHRKGTFRHLSQYVYFFYIVVVCFKWSEDGDDKDGASKVNLRSFSLHRYYSNSLASLNVGEVPLELNHKVRNRKKILRCLFFVLHRTWSWIFSRRSRAVTGTKSSQKCTAPAKLFCLLNQFFFFLRSRCCPHRLILRSLSCLLAVTREKLKVILSC